MKVDWLGHASMLLTSSGGLKVLTDPYTSGTFGVNYGPVEESADVVTVSHDHADHNNVSSVKGNPEVVNKLGSHSVKGIEFRGVASHHDDSSGSQRGSNIIFCFTLDGIRVCHLGDLGHALSREAQKEIGQVDVLFIPVGGNFTVDGKLAGDISRKLNPKIVIPMHYQNERCPEFPVAGVDEFAKLMEQVKRENASQVELQKESLPSSMEVLVLKPAL